MTWLVVSCLILAAALLGWPANGRRARWRRLLADDQAGRRGATAQPTRWMRGIRAVSPDDLRFAVGGGLSTRGMVVLAVGAAVMAGLLGGPVALVVVAAYLSLGIRSVVLRRRRGALARQRTELLDQLGVAAADLRAGLPVGMALAEVTAAGAPASAPPGTVATVATEVDGLAGRATTDAVTNGNAAGLAARAQAAVRLAEQTGAPLAALIERIEADARNADRAAAAATAQVAGARATAWLLAALPLAGLGLGYAIGAEPLPILLRTPLGAAAAIGAVILQLGGLGWVTRITRMPQVAQ